MLSEERLQEIRARHEAAEFGRWEWDQVEEMGQYGQMLAWALSSHDGTDWIPVIVPHVMAVPSMDAKVEVLSIMPADAEFIAHAHQDVPDLLDEVARLREVLQGAKIDGHERECERFGSSDNCICWIADHNATIDSALRGNDDERP